LLLTLFPCSALFLIQASLFVNLLLSLLLPTPVTLLRLADLSPTRQSARKRDRLTEIKDDLIQEINHIG